MKFFMGLMVLFCLAGCSTVGTVDLVAVENTAHESKVIYETIDQQAVADFLADKITTAQYQGIRNLLCAYRENQRLAMLMYQDNRDAEVLSRRLQVYMVDLQESVANIYKGGGN